MVSSDFVTYEGYMLVPYYTARAFVESPRVLVRQDVRDRLGDDCHLSRYLLVRVSCSFGWVGLPMVYAMSNNIEDMLEAAIILNDDVQYYNETMLAFSQAHRASGGVSYEIWEVLPGDYKHTNESYVADMKEYAALDSSVDDFFSRFFRPADEAAGIRVSRLDSGSGCGVVDKAASSLLVYFGSTVCHLPRVTGVRCLLCGDDCGPWVTRYALKPHDEPYYLCESCESLDRTLTMLFEAGER